VSLTVRGQVRANKFLGCAGADFKSTAILREVKAAKGPEQQRF